MNSLEVRNLTVAYQDKLALFDVNFDLPTGEMVGIIGPNGAGKSTLIKALLNLTPKVSGQVLFCGKSYQEFQENIAYIPQKNSVDWNFPINVLDAVTMGLYKKIGLFKRVTQEHKAQALEAIKTVQLEDLTQRQIGELSGGQQQRIFLARAIVQNASIYVLDEPFVGIDMKTEHIIIDILKQMAKNGHTIIVVHHNLDTALSYFDEILLINKTLIAKGDVTNTLTNNNIEKTYRNLD